MKKVIYQNTLDFGKIDFEGVGKPVNRVTVEIELRSDKPFNGFTYPKDTELSICGNIYNKSNTDVVSCGQNYDTLLEVAGSPLMYEIVGVWKRWHLNGMKAGDEAQEKYLRENNIYTNYNETCEILKAVDLYEHNGYVYGSAWKFEQIPDKILRQITKWSTN